jgi:hypothetical protein
MVLRGLKPLKTHNEVCSQSVFQIGSAPPNRNNFRFSQGEDKIFQKVSPNPYASLLDIKSNEPKSKANRRFKVK